ncbi:MAG: monovalent cation/H(+) antiporter subunit G [Spirochaetales bacterium]|nr:monovalent cation/H(+) antiporter subunit G [Spirochaetales bacterium]
MSIREIFALISFIVSAVFGLAGVAGLFRFPGPYARLQAGSLCGTTSVFTAFIGVLILAPSWAIAFRIIIIMILFMVNAPVSSFIVARFTWESGTPMWKPKKKPRRRKAAAPAAGKENPGEGEADS